MENCVENARRTECNHGMQFSWSNNDDNSGGLWNRLISF